MRKFYLFPFLRDFSLRWGCAVLKLFVVFLFQIYTGRLESRKCFFFFFLQLYIFVSPSLIIFSLAIGILFSYLKKKVRAFLWDFCLIQWYCERKKHNLLVIIYCLLFFKLFILLSNLNPTRTRPVQAIGTWPVKIFN